MLETKGLTPLGRGREERNPSPFPSFLMVSATVFRYAHPSVGFAWRDRDVPPAPLQPSITHPPVCTTTRRVETGRSRTTTPFNAVVLDRKAHFAQAIDKAP